MSTQLENPIFAKKVYVPSWSRKAAEPAPQKLLPPDLCLQRATRVFRTIAWDGTGKTVDVALEALAGLEAKKEPPNPIETARVLFMKIPWTGEAPAKPTEMQSARSAERVFASFKWE